SNAHYGQGCLAQSDPFTITGDSVLEPAFRPRAGLRCGGDRVGGAACREGGEGGDIIIFPTKTAQSTESRFCHNPSPRMTSGPPRSRRSETCAGTPTRRMKIGQTNVRTSDLSRKHYDA